MYLDATIPPKEVPHLANLTQLATQLNPISPKKLFYELQQNGTQSSYFSPLKSFFSYLFGNFAQTVLSEGHMLIGNGIDLTATPSAIALFYELDPRRDWKALLSKPGQPNPSLSDDQINQLLNFSLLGVSNSNGTFTGYLIQLNQHLDQLFNKPINYNFLVGMVSLFCLNNGTAPNNLQNALSIALNGNDLPFTQVITEYSNQALNVTTQNKLLRIGAMVHANTNASDLDVYLTYRQKERILSANSDASIKITNGPVKRGLPSRNFQENTFPGFKNMTTLPSMNPDFYASDFSVLGTPENDKLIIMPGVGDPIGLGIYGGDQDDILGVTPLSMDDYSNAPRAIFMAGNRGNDSYIIDSATNHPSVTSYGIYDADHMGTLSMNIQFVGSLRIMGPIIDNKLMLQGSNVFSAQSIIEDDGSTTLQLVSSYTGKMEIFDYQNGQFGILPNADSYQIPIQRLSVSAVNTQGIIALCPTQDLRGSIYFYDRHGKFLNKIPLLEKNQGWGGDISVSADAKGNFHIAGYESTTCKMTYSMVNVNNLLFQTLVDEVPSPNPDNCSVIAPFGPSMLTPTDGTKEGIALTYVKQEKTNQLYGLYLYMSENNQKQRIDSISVKSNTEIFFKDKLYAGPTEQGFIVANTLHEVYQVPFSTQIYEFSRKGVLNSKSVGINTTIVGISPLNGGYFLLYNYAPSSQDQGNLYSKIIRYGNASTPLQITNFGGEFEYDKFTGPIVEPLSNGWTLMLNLYNGNCIFSPNNTLEACFEIGDSLFTPPLRGYLGACLLENNNTQIVYNDISSGYRTVELQTKYLIEPDKAIKRLSRNVLQEDVHVEKFVEENKSMSAAQNLPNAIKQGIQLGALRGITTVAEKALRSSGCISKENSNVAKNIIYYGGFFGLRLNYHLTQDESPETILSSAYNAAIETGQFLLINYIVDSVGEFLTQSGEQLKEKGWNKTSTLLKGSASFIRFGIFGWNAAQEGIMQSSATMATAATTQLIIEGSGRYLLNYANNKA